MRYMGGKARIAANIVRAMAPHVATARGYLEPFLGGANVACAVKHERKVLSDRVECLVAMWAAVARGWRPPEIVSREQYNAADRAGKDPMTAFIGFGCSFSGKFFGGYATDSTGRNYAKNASRSIESKRDGLIGSCFVCADYSAFDPEEFVIYCDPPYANTTRYDAVGSFDHARFWDRVRVWGQRNIVFVSEYAAPSDIVEYARFETKTDMRTNSGKQPRTERLFIVAPWL